MNETGLRKIAGGLGVRILGKNGHWLQAACPFAPYRHERGTDRNPSFGFLVNEQGESYYKCFSCKSKGRISSLVRALEELRDEQYEGLALEADRMDYDYTLPTYEELQAQQEEIVLEALNEAVYGDIYPSVFDCPECHNYLRERNVGKAAAQKMNLRFDPEEQRIIFPVRGREGELYGFTGRTILTPDAWPYKRYPKVRDYAGLPKEFLLLGAEHVREGLPVLVVEGLFGYANLIEIGATEIVNPVAMLGSELTMYKADLLIDWGMPTYLLPDNDEAGDTCLFGPRAGDASGRRLGGGAIDKLKGELPLFIPEWPEGKADPDELTLQDVQNMLDESPVY